MITDIMSKLTLLRGRQAERHYALPWFEECEIYKRKASDGRSGESLSLESTLIEVKLAATKKLAHDWCGGIMAPFRFPGLSRSARHDHLHSFQR